MVVDKYLVLASLAKRAEPPFSVEGDVVGAGPGPIGGTRVDEAEWIVTSVVEADRDGAWRKPSNLGVFDSTGRRVNIDLERVFADLR